MRRLESRKSRQDSFQRASLWRVTLVPALKMGLVWVWNSYERRGILGVLFYLLRPSS